MKKVVVLTSANIDVLSEDIFGFLNKQKQTKDNIIKARLSAETAMLRWLENGYKDKNITLECAVKFGRPVVRLMLQANKFDSLQTQSEGEEYFSLLQENLACVTVYRYVQGTNILDIKLPFNRFATWQKNLMALVLSVVTWAMLHCLLPSAVIPLNTYVVTPTFKVLLGLMTALASFMVFFNVLNAICHMGDISTLSKLGTGLIKQVEKVNFTLAVFVFGVGYFIFDVVNFAGSVNAGMFAEIYKMFLNIIPNSFVQPFLNGNTLQILFMSVLGGVLLLILGQQTQIVTKSVNELNHIFMTAISQFGIMIPLIVYLSFTSLLLSNKMSLLVNMWKIPVVVYGLGLIWFVCYAIYTALVNHNNIKKYFFQNLSVFMLGYTMASTMPCIPLMNKTLEEQGVDNNYRDFALPLCQILCSTGIIISMGTVALGLAEMAGIKLSLSTFLITMFSVFLLAQTVPPVTGSSISVMVLILAQINVPQDFISLFVSIGYFLNMMRVGVSKSSAMNSVYTCANREGKLNR